MRASGAVTHGTETEDSMQSRTLILIAATLATAAACKKGNDANAPANAASTATPTENNANSNAAAPAMVAEHGGSVATSGGMITEVVTQPDGRLMAYVRGPQGAVADANVRVTVRNTDGTSRPVVVAWDAQSSAYVGYVWGVEPGMKTVDVSIAANGNATAPAQTVSSQVNVAAVAHPPAARYGGSVEIIGQYAVEIVPSRTGDLAFVVMALEGNPVPDASIELPHETIDTGAIATAGGTVAAGGTVNAGGSVAIGAPPAVNAAGGAVGTVAVAAPAAPSAGLGTAVLVPVRQGDHWMAHVEPTVIATAPSVSFNVDLSVGGHVYSKAQVPAAPVVAVLPPAIAVGGSGSVAVRPGLGVAVPVAPGAPVGSVNVQANGGVAVPAVVANVNVGARVLPPPVPQPVGGVVVAPPRVRVNGGVVVAPPNGAVMVAPPRGGVVVGGMAGGVVVQPPSGGVVVAPPRAGVIVAPPSGAVMVAPPRGGVIVAPPSGGVVVGARAGATLNAPPRPVVAPPPPVVIAPPGPPRVNVQGGFQVGGSVNIH